MKSEKVISAEEGERLWLQDSLVPWQTNPRLSFIKLVKL